MEGAQQIQEAADKRHLQTELYMAEDLEPPGRAVSNQPLHPKELCCVEQAGSTLV